METNTEKLNHWEDQVNIILAVWLFLAPSVLRYADNAAAAWSAYGVGAIIAVLAVAAQVRFKVWEEWSSLVLGCALAASPWLLGFNANASATWNHVVTGLLIIVMCVWELSAVANRSSPA